MKFYGVDGYDHGCLVAITLRERLRLLKVKHPMLDRQEYQVQIKQSWSKNMLDRNMGSTLGNK